MHKKAVSVMVNLDNLFKLMQERGVNAKKVSEATGISSGNISDWKSGRSMPSAAKLDILADYLDCSVDYLLGRDEPKKPAPTNGGELDPELADLIRRIPADRMAEVRRYLRFQANREEKP